MALELNLTLDRRNIARFRTLLSANRTMAAKSLTFTAEKAVPAWRAGHSVFHRRNDWIDKGVRLRAATRSNLTAKVGTVDRYMGRHIKGLGERKTPGKARALLVPLYGNIGEVPEHRVIRRVARAGNRAKHLKTFTLKRSGKTFLAKRLDRKHTKMRILGMFMGSNDTRQRLDAVGIVGREVNQHFPRVYERLLLKWAETGAA